MKLYDYYRSSSCYRVRIALNYKGIEYAYRAVDLTKAVQHEASYADLNPMKEIPSIVTEKGEVIAQSVAICLWLDRTYKSKSLFPEDALGMSQVLQFCENINAGIHPIQNLKVRQELTKQFNATPADVEKWCAYWIERGFQSLEKSLSKTSGKFAFGDSVTAADMFLVPQVYNARRYKLDLTPFPNIVNVDKNANELEAFKKAHPTLQPDTPK